MREIAVRVESRSSPRLSQLDSCFIERGVLQVKRLRRAAVISIFPWNGSIDPNPEPKPVPNERRDPLKLARYYESLLDSGKFESRAAVARYLGVSRAVRTHGSGDQAANSSSLLLAAMTW